MIFENMPKHISTYFYFQKAFFALENFDKLLSTIETYFAGQIIRKLKTLKLGIQSFQS